MGHEKKKAITFSYYTLCILSKIRYIGLSDIDGMESFCKGYCIRLRVES